MPGKCIRVEETLPLPAMNSELTRRCERQRVLDRPLAGAGGYSLIHSLTLAATAIWWTCSRHVVDLEQYDPRGGRARTVPANVRSIGAGRERDEQRGILAAAGEGEGTDA